MRTSSNIRLLLSSGEICDNTRVFTRSGDATRGRSEKDKKENRNEREIKHGREHDQTRLRGER